MVGLLPFINVKLELLARCSLDSVATVIQGTMQANSGLCCANSFCLSFFFARIKINRILEKSIFVVFF
jgi:hypothetical protein